MVYSFIALSAAGIGALAYFALTFTPANAILVAIVFACCCFVIMERRVRIRAENRLERAIEDLSRLLATDAQAGAVLGQRINAIADTNPGQRLETVEADISVLGTVIRQVAEAVSEIEEKVAQSNRRALPMPGSGSTMAAPARSRPQTREREPVIPLETLRQAMSENRLVQHIQPILRLPHRRATAYDLVPRLMLDPGEFADPADFMPRRGGYDLVRHIEGMALSEAVAVARRSRASGAQVSLHVPLSRATLGDGAANEQAMATLDANRPILDGLTFLIEESEWLSLTGHERAALDQMKRKGAGFSLCGATSLRVDIADMASAGMRSLRIDAASLLEEPEAFTDFHLSDIVSYLARFDVTLVATGIANERQIIELIDNDILLVQGDYLAPPGQIRHDLSLEAGRTVAAPQLRRG